MLDVCLKYVISSDNKKLFIKSVSGFVLRKNIFLVVMGKPQSSEYWRCKELEFSSLIHDKSSNITFGVSQKTNIIGHTAILLIFDGKPWFTIDFGTMQDRESKATLGREVPGNVQVNYFDDKIMEKKYEIATFELKTETQKLHIEMLCITLINMKVGNYNVLENNCRDYVVAAYTIISAFKSVQTNADDINWKDVEESTKNSKILLECNDLDECLDFLRDLKEKDKEKLKMIANTVAGVGGGVGGTAVIVGIGGLVVAIPTGGFSLIASAAAAVAGGVLTAGTGLGFGISYVVKIKNIE